jgi:hypothetical protein
MAVRRYHPLLRLIGRRVSTLMAEEGFPNVSKRFQEVGDHFYAARARLRLIAPPDILELMDEVDELSPHRRWRHVGWTILDEYRAIRQRFIDASRRVADAEAKPARTASNRNATERALEPDSGHAQPVP